MDYPEDADLYGADVPPAVFPPVADLVMTWDEEAQGWMGTSPSVPGLITSATTQDELREKAAMYAWHLRKPITPAEQAIVDRAYADYAARLADPIATYHANRAAKAQRVARHTNSAAIAGTGDIMQQRVVEEWFAAGIRDWSDVPSMTDEQAAAFAKASADYIRGMKGGGEADAIDDDLPTLPPTALRTWEGWGG